MDHDGARDEFMRTLRPVLRKIGDLDELREHPLFRALLAIHGEAQVRGWLILEGLRLARQVALDERGMTSDPLNGHADLADGEAWPGPGIVQRLCENAAYVSESGAS
jgi:hypothetical protein